MRDLIERLLFRRVDASSLAVFRMMFGALMLFEAVNYGFFLCLDCMYRETELLFKYRGFEWVRLLPGPGLEMVFVLMALSATGVMLGLFYRASAVLLVLTFSYLFFLDQALYLNHFYLAILFAVIMVFVPAHRYWSLDARRRPEIASATVPNWGRFWLGAQLEIVLLYAGFVKLNGDWLNLEPMRLWMTTQAADEAAFFRWVTEDWGIALASYAVIALHIVGAPLLLWRRTRLVVFCIYAVFHTINAFVFNIGIFPWMTLGATLLLFDPDWPRQAYRWLRERLGGRLGPLSMPVPPAGPSYASAGAPSPSGRPPTAALGRAAAPSAGASSTTVATGGPARPGTGDARGVPAANGVAGEIVGETSGRGGARSGGGGGSAAAFDAPPRGLRWTLPRAVIVALVGAWLLAQLVVPLRHFAAPGNVAWNEDGHRFSWRMKLRSKRGRASFVVQRDDGLRLVVDPADHLTSKQTRKMACIPDLLWQFAQYLEEKYDEGGTREVAVYADTRCSLNTREPTPILDRLVDLTEIERDHPVTEWVTPLTKPLPNPIF